jgi:sporulation protein YlmC with PRC-barrel domain
MTDTKRQPGLAILDNSDPSLGDPADDLRGLTVVDACHHRVGEVDGLIIDEEHRRARLLVVASGGVVGLVRMRRLVPVEAVTRVDDVVHIDVSHVQVHRAEYDPDLAPSLAYQQMCTHYGYPPFWEKEPSVSGLLDPAL